MCKVSYFLQKVHNFGDFCRSTNQCSVVFILVLFLIVGLYNVHLSKAEISAILRVCARILLSDHRIIASII